MAAPTRLRTRHRWTESPPPPRMRRWRCSSARWRTAANAEPVVVSAETELELEPSIDRARELAHAGNAIPVRMSFVDDCETPVSAFLKLRTDAPCFLLESAEQGRLGRYSFLGFSPRAIL